MVKMQLFSAGRGFFRTRKQAEKDLRREIVRQKRIGAEEGRNIFGRKLFITKETGPKGNTRFVVVTKQKRR